MKKIFYTTLALCAVTLSVSAQTPSTPTTTPEVKLQNPATIKFEETEHDFGTITEGQSVTYTFKFTNTGTTDLTLENVQASCGCTTPNWSKGPYAPGASGEITATYNSTGKGVGVFSKTITVYSNAGQVMLFIRGTAAPKAEPSPAGDDHNHTAGDGHNHDHSHAVPATPATPATPASAAPGKAAVPATPATPATPASKSSKEAKAGKSKPAKTKKKAKEATTPAPSSN